LRETKIGEGNGKRRRLDRRRDDDSASARRAVNRRAVVKRSPDVGAERFIVNLRKRVQLFLQKCKNFALTAFCKPPNRVRRRARFIFFIYFGNRAPSSALFLTRFGVFKENFLARRLLFRRVPDF